MDHFHAYFSPLVNGLGLLLAIVFVFLAVRTFKYVDKYHAAHGFLVHWLHGDQLPGPARV